MQCLQVYSETVSMQQNIFRQIFEELEPVKIFPRQIFALYGI